MRLAVNDKWSIVIDIHNNHSPEEWVVKEGGKLVIGKITKPFEGWVSHGKHYSNVPRAIRYIATQDTSDDIATVQEYVDKVASNVERMLKEMRTNE
jgi:hypothetical protein